MTLLWIGNLVLLIVIPVVVLLLSRLMQPVRRIQQQVDGLAMRAGSLVTLLEAVNELPRTGRLVKETGAGLGRYGAALDEIL